MVNVNMASFASSQINSYDQVIFAYVNYTGTSKNTQYQDNDIVKKYILTFIQ